MWVHKCGSLCTTSGYGFFSLGEGTVCMCGQELAASPKSAAIIECNVGCGNGPGVGRLSYLLAEAELSINIEYCAKYCLLTQGQTLFGLEGTTCRCGLRLDVGAEGRPTTDCAAPCAGDDTQACGGQSLLNIFSASGARGRPLPSAAIWNLTIERCAEDCTRRFEGSEVVFSVGGGDRCNCALPLADDLLVLGIPRHDVAERLLETCTAHGRDALLQAVDLCIYFHRH
ncbi:hypothetical protein B0J13DRAFT_628340 [Dactylonectria estremocensis]|uniref:WSC domain-containing protein n=1 Tax=Dactylonectria estremocensis TaxID=1079267 RepID=A0A9P9DTL8_9HYPO|nr:hypothetical protein B0J13DRAFT_628340 [Dactylonectria estremocensis]